MPVATKNRGIIRKGEENMLKLRKGCKVPFPERLSEGYEHMDFGIVANVGADKIRSVLEHFIAIWDEKIFFILELPSALKDEVEIRPGVLAAKHKDVYYIDGCTAEKALTILAKTADLLINDGMSTFGFGCHESKDEILIGYYNVVSIYTSNKERYDGFFEAHEINQVETLLTAWDTFSQETPGESEIVVTDGKRVYDIPEMFKDWGIYFAERREE